TLNVTGLPGYFHGDLMDVTTEAGRVFIRDAETLASPLRLTQEEACSVLVGLKALTAVPGTPQAQSLHHAIDSVAAVAGDDAWLADAVVLELVTGAQMDTIAALQQAIVNSRACTITYLVRNRDELSERTVEPRRLFSIDSDWYVRAWCRRANGLRSFRVENIKDLSDAGMQVHAPSGRVSWEPGGGMYDPGSADVQVRISADTATARRLGPAYNAELFELGNGTAGLAFLVGDTAMLGPLMARLGGYAQVVSPASAREAAAAWLWEAACSYDAVGETVRPVPSVDG
ncbi:YafY family protein, partial [Arthrobacter sp.]|uniref:helix-turn-helix transcriptional regulator n=1 Tax=Arthrobacter sp. TaxID=1667 RepID=UPI0026DF75FF